MDFILRRRARNTKRDLSCTSFYGTPEFVQKNKNKEKVRKIVLAYGVSANKKPDILWGSEVDGKITIKEAFKEWNYNTSDAEIKKYNSSYVYKIYEWTDNVNYALIQNVLGDRYR